MVNASDQWQAQCDAANTVSVRPAGCESRLCGRRAQCLSPAIPRRSGLKVRVAIPLGGVCRDHQSPGCFSDGSSGSVVRPFHARVSERAVVESCIRPNLSGDRHDPAVVSDWIVVGSNAGDCPASHREPGRGIGTRQGDEAIRSHVGTEVNPHERGTAPCRKQWNSTSSA